MLSIIKYYISLTILYRGAPIYYCYYTRNFDVQPPPTMPSQQLCLLCLFPPLPPVFKLSGARTTIFLMHMLLCQSTTIFMPLLLEGVFFQRANDLPVPSRRENDSSFNTLLFLCFLCIAPRMLAVIFFFLSHVSAVLYLCIKEPQKSQLTNKKGMLLLLDG